MKINVGDYVRTKTGIYKVFEINEKTNVLWKYICDKKPTGEWDGSYEYTTTRDENIIKSSPNIIDLIEVGDYVNNKQIDYIDSAGFPYYEEIDENGYVHSYRYDEGQIKSIVTKEQFESMQYVIKED